MIPEMPMPDEYADLHLFSVRKIFDTYRPTVMVRDLLNKSKSASSFVSCAHFDVADYVHSQRSSKSNGTSSLGARKLHQPMTSSRSSTANNISLSSSLAASLHGSLSNVIRTISLSAVQQLQPLPMLMYK